METARVVEQQSLVIRRISNYADGHKYLHWQIYAAGAAAAFAMQLVHAIPYPREEAIHPSQSTYILFDWS